MGSENMEFGCGKYVCSWFENEVCEGCHGGRRSWNGGGGGRGGDDGVEKEVG
ncbi:hypothetical protein Hanom_Chr05g00429181 [Helianthus anomalus]